MVSRSMANLSNYGKTSGMRRIVGTHRHLRESQRLVAGNVSLPWFNGVTLNQGLYRPHIDKATVPRTGTLPPPSCGKEPTAVRESVMVLPGSPRQPAARLTGKGSEQKSWKTAAIVVGGRESRLQGERRQVRGLLISTHVKAPYD